MVFRLTIFIAVFSCFHVLHAQNDRSYFKTYPELEGGEPEWVKLMYSDNPNFYEVEEKYSAYYQNHPFEKNQHTKNYLFWILNVEDLINNDGFIEDPHSESYLERENLLRNKKDNFRKKNTSVAKWKNISHNANANIGNTSLIGNRQINTYCIGVAPSNRNVVYAAAEGAGIFKTTNKGRQWVLMTRDDDFVSGSDIKVHPNDPDIVYLANKKVLIKTIDGGINWKKIYTAKGIIEQFFINPINPNKIYAATSNGLLYSEDEGISWEELLSKKCWDIQGHPTNPNILYVGVSNTSLNRNEVYRSTNGKSNWKLMDKGWFRPSNPREAKIAGIKLGVSKAEPDALYAAVIGKAKAADGSFIGLFYSPDKGENWQNPRGHIGAPYTTDKWDVISYAQKGGSSQGWYDFDMDVSDIDSKKVWVGGIMVYRSDDRGATFKRRITEVKSDCQDIDTEDGDVWITTDGDISLFENEKSHSYRHFGVNECTFWGFDHGWNLDIWGGGRYHNGDMVKYEHFEGSHLGKSLRGGEVATGYVDDFDNRILRFSDHGDILVTPDISKRPENVKRISHYPNQHYVLNRSSEVVQHPVWANYTYLGLQNNFMRATDGYNFSTIHAFPSGSLVIDIEISRNNPDIIYCTVIKSNNTTIYRSSNGGNSFSAMAELPSNRSYVKISLDAENENNLWAISKGGGNGAKVYQSLNGGKEWINRTTGTLNGERLTAIAYQYGTDDLVYVSSEKNFFYYDKSKSDWVQYSNNLPFLNKSFTIFPFYRDSKIKLATRRGIWDVDFAKPSKPLAQPYVQKKSIDCNSNVVQLRDYSVIDHEDASWEWTINPAPTYISSTTVSDPVVLFTKRGSYDITLTVSDKYGQSSTKTIKDMVVLNNNCNNSAVAFFESKIKTCEKTVNFANKSFNATTYSWDFGDGSSSSNANPTHTFSESKTYEVTLTVNGGHKFSQIIELDALPSPNLGEDAFVKSDEFPLTLDPGFYTSDDIEINWFKNGVLIPEEKNSNYVTTNQCGDYKIEVSNGVCSNKFDEVSISSIEDINFTSSAVVSDECPCSTKEMCTYKPIFNEHDSYIRNGGHSNNNYGREEYMVIKNDPASGYKRQSFIQFDVSSLGVLKDHHSVILQLTELNGLVNQPIAYYHINNDNWNETTLTWNNAAQLEGNPYITQNLNKGTNSIDITDFVKSAQSDGKLTIGIQRVVPAGGGNTHEFATKEHSNRLFHPKLIVITYPITTAVRDDLNEIDGVQLYPNPAGEKLNLVLPYNSNNYNLSIIDVLGKEVMIMKGLSTGINQLNTSNLVDGLYYIRLSVGTSQKTIRFVKQ